MTALLTDELQCVGKAVQMMVAQCLGRVAHVLGVVVHKAAHLGSQRALANDLREEVGVCLRVMVR
jgi:hypothetical protein